MTLLATIPSVAPVPPLSPIPACLAPLRCGGSHRLAARQHRRRHHHQRVRQMPVLELTRRLRVVDDRRDVGDVGDVRDVDVLRVARARLVARNKHLARREREPADGRLSAPADVDRHAQLRPADPRHQRRRVHRLHDAHPRRPAPGVAHVDPAAIVERREAPRRVVNPGPAPRAHPGPVASAVRHPVHSHLLRHPQRAVLGVLLPAAIAVELVGAGHLGRHVAHWRAAVAGAVTRVAPVGEGIVDRRGQTVLGHIVLVDKELGALARLHSQARALAFEVGLARIDGDEARTRTPVDPVTAGALHQEAAVGGGNVDTAGLGRVTHPGGDAATAQLHREARVVEQLHVELGAGVEPHGGRAHLQFGPCASVGGKAVAGGERLVAPGAPPFVRIGAPHPHGAFDIREACHPARRVARHRLRCGMNRPGAGEEHGCGQREHARGAEAVAEAVAGGLAWSTAEKRLERRVHGTGLQ